MKKRQSIFLQILVFFLCGLFCADLHGGPFSASASVDQPLLPMTFSAGTVDRIAIQDFIQTRSQMLTRLVGLPPGVKPVVCRLHFNGTAEKPSLRLLRVSGGVELTIFGPFSLWKENFSLQRQLSGALLLTQFGIVPDMADQLPVWIQGTVESNRRAGQYPSLMRKRQYLPGLRYILLEGKLPDFRTLLTADPEAMLPEARNIYFDLCRALLEIAYQADPGKSVLRDYILTERQSNPQTACRVTLERVLSEAGRNYALQNAIDFSGLSPAECAQRYWELRAEQVAFNRAYGYEPEAALARFQQFRKVTLTETKDGKSVPRSMDLADLPNWTGEESTKKLLVLQKSKEFERIRGCFGDEHSHCIRMVNEQLHSLTFGTTWWRGNNLPEALNALEQSLKLAILRDRFAAQQEEKIAPPMLLFHDELVATRRFDLSFLSRDMRDFVDGAEQDYLWEREEK